jgi:hypothetical protein
LPRNIKFQGVTLPKLSTIKDGIRISIMMMPNYRKRQYVIYDDNDNELVWCSTEGEYKPAVEFDVSDNTEHGYMAYCKECRIVFKEKHKDAGLLRINEDKKIAYKMLENLGYKINGEFTIHEQFLIKHHEKISEKKFVRRNKRL